MAAEPVDMLAALDPEKSVVVEACAGSGKTWLLVSRIIRLLLAGVAPGEILAITFTRKGAREMQERLHGWLEELATRPDQWVEHFLRERGIGATEISPLTATARSLFERVLTAQPGIKINTFHGWFAELVQRAPLQAGMAKGYGLTEAVHGLEQEAWQRFGTALATPAASLPQAALDDLFRAIGLRNTRTLLGRFLDKRPEWWNYAAGQGDPAGFAVAEFTRQVGVDLQTDYLEALLNDAVFLDDLRCLFRTLSDGGTKQKEVALGIDLALAMNDRREQFLALVAALFTKTQTVRKALQSYCEQAEARVRQAADNIIDRLTATQHALTEQRALRLNRAAFIAAQSLLEHYQQLKAERSVMDFTDVEYAAYTLLRHSDFAEYMQYKLDSRYRHILLDEFQDTNPLQWMTLQAWLQASSDADLRPTVFLVGDPKQSIFHFRRADARLFSHATEFLRSEYQALVLQQNLSRRSGVAVLGAVNALFTTAKHLSGFVPHVAYDQTLAGAVCLLPLPPQATEQNGAKHSPDALRNLLTTPQPSSDDQRRADEAAELARGIQRIVSSWQVQDAGTLRRASYRDVMILTRGRTQLQRYEAALRAAGIPHISARHGGLLDSLEAQDLIALLQFLLRPSDSLSLVHALRAPLFGCSDEDLVALAQMSGGDWWQRLDALGDDLSPTLRRARDALLRWLPLAANLPVHDLLDRIYFESDLEQRYAMAVPSAMAQSVQANLMAFIELSLTIDSGRYPSLGRFLADLTALGDAPNNEAPDEGSVGDIGNVVRIMTVHGAKGLESPIVWMIDATFTPKSRDAYDVLVTWPTGAQRPDHFSFLTTKNERGPARERYLADEAAIQVQEDANLLYVAMTRAKQYLIVSGNQVGSGGGNWYEALANVAPPTELPLMATPILDKVNPTAETSPRDLPEWYSTPRAHGERKLAAPDNHRDYGIQLHALLEAARDGVVPQMAATHVLRNADAATRDALLKQVNAILRAPHLGIFFDARHFRAARDEVSLIDCDGDLLRIDRIVEFDDSVWVLDYKSAASKVVRASAFMADYRQQLQRYRRALKSIYPDKTLRCGLIFGDAVLEEIE